MYYEKFFVALSMVLAY
jgi:hypothetical protein